MTAISVELSMPRRPDLGSLAGRLEHLPEPIGRVVLTDNHAGTARVSPLAAIASTRATGRRCTVCVSTRDRNRLALFSHASAAVALGADELLCVGGDPIDGLPEPDLKPTQLLASAHEWVAETGARVGAVCGHTLARDGEAPRLTQRKVAAGASFLVTQALWEPDRATALAAAIERLGAEPVIGVPLVTSGSALARLERLAGPAPPAVATRVADGDGAAVAGDLIAAIGAARVHIYPIGAGAWDALEACIASVRAP